ncbi:hypothetical protein MFIFM68171_04728 [Madurella fahalii]|uniref:Uncharacterized protein n=1 Tax=Madurella fahalii TaxID=1157608 RepID=A0ABQ0G9R9_9PEZI
MSTSTSPKIAASSIPNITTLRNELDYGDLHLPRCAAFNDDTNAFRRKFKTSHGIDGVDLHDWKSRDGQNGLNEMTVAYLDKEGNGRIFWPDDRSSNNYNKYQYSKDRPRILRLVKQLFFRLNQQQFRNHKYKHKSKPETKAEDERGRSKQTAIDVDSIPFGSNTPEDSPTQRESSQGTRQASGAGEQPLDAGEAAIDSLPDLEKLFGLNQPIPSNVDIYEVPTSNPPSPPRMRQFEPINQPFGAKRAPTPTDDIAEDRQWKRPKRQPKSSSRPDAKPAAAKSPTDANQQRKSPRTKKQTQRDGFVGLDRISLEGSLSPESGGPGSPPRALTPEASTITFRNPTDGATELKPAETPTPRPRSERESNFPSTLRGHPSSPARSGHEGESGPEPDQSDFAAGHTPITSQDSGKAVDHRQESERPEPPREHPSKPPAIGAAGAAAGELSGGGGGGGSSGRGAKPLINFMYRIVLSRTPKTVTERWSPRGRFQDKTLAELLKELPFNDGEAQGLIFTIESDCMRTVERILNDDEDSFASMKRYINMEIREWFMRQQHLKDGTPPRLAIDILIERMSDDNKPGVNVLGDLELEW